jgi:AcrR family transcriptional regulator
MIDATRESFQERKRRMVRTELVNVAQQLFVAHGYEATTVDQIARAAGMSERTYFRYFPSKEALVLGKYEELGQALSERLAERPEQEGVWESLRRMFDHVVEYSSTEGSRERMQEIDRIVSSTPALRAASLERLARAQEVIAQVVEGRREAEASAESSALEARAIVAAAFACLTAANAEAASGAVPLERALDVAMAAVGRDSQELATR